MLSCAYFCNWSIYQRGYTPRQLPVRELTHVNYAFAKVDTKTGRVELSDPWADVEKPMELGGKGCLGELLILKRQNRNLKVLLSIGGWTSSPNLTHVFAEPSTRIEFARSAVRLVEKHSLDGIDLDWEYPETEEQSNQYVQVVAAIRELLDELASRYQMVPQTFDLSIAAPAGPYQRKVLDIPSLDRYLSFWNLMTYDFAGSWSPKTDHHANLYGGELSGDDTVQYYIKRGVHPSKLILGIPLYGRSFAHTKGIGHTFDGTQPGRYEQGYHDAKDLPFANTTEEVCGTRVAAFCQGDGVLVTYDNAKTAVNKAHYVLQHQLGGGMFWESSQDRNSNQSIISAFVRELGPLAYRENWINFASCDPTITNM